MAKGRLTPRDKARASSRQTLRAVRLQIETIEAAVAGLKHTIRDLESRIEESIYQERKNDSPSEPES